MWRPFKRGKGGRSEPPNVLPIRNYAELAAYSDWLIDVIAAELKRRSIGDLDDFAVAAEMVESFKSQPIQRKWIDTLRTSITFKGHHPIWLPTQRRKS